MSSDKVSPAEPKPRVFFAADFENVGPDMATDLLRSTTRRDTIVGVVMLREPADWAALAEKFRVVIVQNDNAFGQWFDHPPYVVAAWGLGRIVPSSSSPSGFALLLETADQQSVIYHIRPGIEDVIVFPANGGASSPVAILRALFVHAPSTYVPEGTA